MNVLIAGTPGSCKTSLIAYAARQANQRLYDAELLAQRFGLEIPATHLR